MAKNAQKSPAKSPPSALSTRAAEPEIMDSRTGEIVSMENLNDGSSDLLDAQTAAILADSNLTNLLATAAKAKKSDFKSLEKDFWTPGQPGTPDAVLQGVYLGSAKNGRLIQHAVCTTGQKGQPLVVRLNGRHGLTTALRQLQPKDLVRIEYMGEAVSQGLTTASGQGNRFKLWEVTKISSAS